MLQTRCDGCGDCVGACPQGIIAVEDGFPLLDFTRGASECFFCDDCAAACSRGALSRRQARLWRWTAEIGATCLSFQHTACRVCADSCETRAIRFLPMPGGRDIPLIDETACTGCGACSGVCPVGAIRFLENNQNIVEAVG